MGLGGMFWTVFLSRLSTAAEQMLSRSFAKDNPDIVGRVQKAIERYQASIAR